MSILIVVLMTVHAVVGAVPPDRLVATKDIARVADGDAVARDGSGSSGRLPRVTLQRPKQPASAPRGKPAGEVKDVVWLTGTVRDAAGHALAGADVFARTEYEGSGRLYEVVRSTTADDRGGYEIRGPAHSFFGGLSVVVRAIGHPPAVATASSFSNRDGKPATLHVTVAERAGSARITVLKRGKPLANASVALDIERGVFPPYPRGRSPALEDVARPVVQTGSDGVARFSDLFPGLYRLHVVESPIPRRNRIHAPTSLAKAGTARAVWE